MFMFFSCILLCRYLFWFLLNMMKVLILIWFCWDSLWFFYLISWFLIMRVGLVKFIGYFDLIFCCLVLILFWDFIGLMIEDLSFLINFFWFICFEKDILIICSCLSCCVWGMNMWVYFWIFDVLVCRYGVW